MKLAIFYAIAGTVAAILNLAAITGPILWAVTHGGSLWLLWFLFTPALLFGTGMVASAWAARQADNAKQVPPVREYSVLDEELPPELSAAEHEMVLRNLTTTEQHRLLASAAAMWEQPWPLNLAGMPAVLTDEKGQRP